MIKIFFSLFIVSCLFLPAHAQTEKIPCLIYTTKEARSKEYKSLISSINKNLLLDVTDSTEENWMDVFNALEFLNYKTAFIDARIRTAMDSVEYRSLSFQRSIIQLIYNLYAKDFVPQVGWLVKKTIDPKLFAMCSEYLFLNNKTETYKSVLLKQMEEMQKVTGGVTEVPFFSVIKNKLFISSTKRPPLTDLLNNSFLPGEMVVYSFQRKNRDYPGLVMVRGKDGKFVTNTTGKYFAVPQLARSGSNMPGYISNGNTPQGIFKIFGFANSKSVAIGPTTNIQMVLPYENSTDVSDSVTRSLGDNYRFLLPVSWKNYYPIFEAYYAGKAGRTEIIAHGTTVNPEYYKKQTYYPLTPTEGCLCTKEIWSAIDGKRIESDQQKLIDAVKKTGSTEGYLIVVEIDDQQKPVSLAEILPLLR